MTIETTCWFTLNDFIRMWCMLLMIYLQNWLHNDKCWENLGWIGWQLCLAVADKTVPSFGLSFFRISKTSDEVIPSP